MRISDWSSDVCSSDLHRITMTDFRLCSACRPCSQAGLCHCTQQLISDQPEPTFARLRYSLGGDRPSQTTHHAGSRTRVHGPRLDTHDRKGGISRLPPRRLARSEEHTSELQSLMRISYAVFCLKNKKQTK